MVLVGTAWRPGQHGPEPVRAAGRQRVDAGKGWFSTGSMLARMNFASALTQNQRFRLTEMAAARCTPESLLAWTLESIKIAPISGDVEAELANYLVATGPWTASNQQLQAKVPGSST